MIRWNDTPTRASADAARRFLAMSACGLLAAFAMAAPAQADFAGLLVEDITDNDDGLAEYAVSAVFDDPTDVLLNVFNRNTTSTTGFFHNSIDGTNQSALPYPSGATAISDNPDADSFVTIALMTGDDNTTALDPNFCTSCFIEGNALGDDSGWFNSNPANQQGLAGADGKVLIAVFTPLNDGGGAPGVVSGILEITYASDGETTFGSGDFTTNVDPVPCGDPGAGDCCAANGTPACDDEACCEVVCAVDSLCCDIAWDASCAEQAAALCPPCDRCPGDGDCCVANGTPGCDDETCCDAVCAGDPHCCDVAWDAGCAAQATDICPACDPCPGEGDCCEPNGTPGCDDAECCDAVCSLDPTCCADAWDATCAGHAVGLCGCPGSAGFLGLAVEDITDNDDGLSEYAVYALFDDPEDILLNVFNRNTTSSTGFFHNTIDGANESALPYTTGATGISDNPDADSFVTIGLFTGDDNTTALDPNFCFDCFINGTSLGGNSGWFNSNPPNEQGAAGDDGKVLIAVFTPLNDGDGNPGLVTGQLEITYLSNGETTFGAGTFFTVPPVCGDEIAGDCCVANGTPACDDAACCNAVCAADSFCCDTVWDDSCAALAAALCAECQGACCFPDGSCDVLPPADCMAGGGAFQGFLVGCRDVDCPLPTGACCLPDGSCDVLTQGDCRGSGGTYEGDFTTCSGVSCPQPPGACCFLDGTCAVLGERDCDAQGGVFQGGLTDCDTTRCPVVCGPGAGDCCDIRGNGSPGCDDAVCCETVCESDGFCCDTAWDGECAEAASLVCELCQQPGACCLGDGSCLYVSGPAECAGLGGAYQGAGSMCAIIKCPLECGSPGTGSCEEANGTPFCDDEACCLAVCAIDAFCCDVEWDAICVDLAVGPEGVCFDAFGPCDGGASTVCDMQIGINGGFVQECEDGQWVSVAWPIQTDGATVDTVSSVHLTNTGQGSIYVTGGTCDGPDVSNILATLCCAIEGEPSGEKVNHCFPAVATSSTDPTWIVMTFHTGFSFDVMYDAGTINTAEVSFANLDGGSDPGLWGDLADFNFGAQYCVDLLNTGCDAPVYECPAVEPVCPGDGDCFIDNGTPGCDDVDCCEAVCAIDPFCCDVAWDGICADQAIDICGGGGDCPQNDQCGIAGTGDCLDPDGTGSPGCEDNDCCNCVCQADPFCCDVEWDSLCAGEAAEEPACGGGGGSCGTGDCCSANGSPGCDDDVCCESVCAADAFCCDVEWDDICADQATDLCDVCEGGGGCPDPLCFGDINADGIVDGADLGLLLGSWGSDDPCTDLDEDGTTGQADLDLLLAAWGPC